MNKKAEKFLEYLEANRITCFQKDEIADDFGTVVFRSTMDVAGQVLPVAVITDHTIYALLRVRVIANAINEHNEVAVRKYIDGLNKKFKLFKYYVQDINDRNSDLVVDICMPSTEETFEASLVHALIGTLLKHLIEEYPVAMKYIWSDSNQNIKPRSPRTKKDTKSKTSEETTKKRTAEANLKNLRNGEGEFA